MSNVTAPALEHAPGPIWLAMQTLPRPSHGALVVAGADIPHRAGTEATRGFLAPSGVDDVLAGRQAATLDATWLAFAAELPTARTSSGCILVLIAVCRNSIFQRRSRIAR